MEAFFLEKMNLKSINAPSDGDTAITGARVGMKNGQRVSFIIHMAASTGANVVFSLKQHNASASGTTKALSIDNPYFVKAGAATKFTKVEPTAKTAEYDLSTTFASDAGIVVFEVLSENLDRAGGFNWVSVNAADTGSMVTKLIGILAVVHTLAYLPAYSQDL